MRRLALLVALAASIATVAPASASELVDRNAKNVRLRVDKNDVALVEYSTKKRKAHHVLYWGGMNWSLTFAGHDRSGGWKSKKADWKKFKNTCGPYTGPALRNVIEACTQPDGTHWALQSWQRLKRNYGGRKAPRELRLSHWQGDLPQLTVKMDWAWGGRYDHLYGTYTYLGRPVVPGKTTRRGAVLDGKGRNILIESFDSDMGAGWTRVNGFLANKPNGQFCFTFGPKRPYTAHTGRSPVGRYSAWVPGPGVAPDVFLDFAPTAPAYDALLDEIANAEQILLRSDVRGGSCDKVN